VKPFCEQLQSILTDRGPAALQDDAAAQAHLVECGACFALLEALAALDANWTNLPVHNAPDAVVARLRDLTRVPAAAPAAPTWVDTALTALRETTRLLLRPRLALPVTAVAALLLAVVLTPKVHQRSDKFIELAGKLDDKNARENASVPVGQEGIDEAQVVVSAPETRGEGAASEPPGRRDAPPPDQGLLATAKQEPAPARVAAAKPASPAQSGRAAGLGAAGAQGGAAPPAAPAPMAVPWERTNHLLAGDRADVDDLVELPDEVQSELESDLEMAARSQVDASVGGKEASVVGGAGGAEAKARVAAKAGELRGSASTAVDDVSGDEPARLVRAFWNERAALTNLSFRPPHGYWANTYVPGDPAVRLLQMRLAARDRQTLQQFASAPLRLDAAARQAAQPFDVPRDAALALYVHADRAGLQAQSRLVVQVGVQATPRHGGRRSAMNVGLVLDARGTISADVAARMRALVLAFAGARETGDRFTLHIAGRGAAPVGADEFKHGPLAVRLDELFAHSPDPGATVRDAVEAATVGVRAADDPNTPLGSSAVVLITSQPLGPEAEAVAALAHRGAVNGIPLSVVAVGGGESLEELDRIALAGQGSRRVLDAPAAARRLVDRELSAVGRAVARAVRLRIRLAPGVQLVGILGARPLDTQRAQQVRQAERSIDRRMADNLGIQADRGTDEGGIQIVIPTYYAGDAHVVLLDVVAPGPGPIAEVTMRYKDLVYVRNATARTSLHVPRSNAAPGPLERNVLKNLLAHRQAVTLAAAGRSLANGDDAAAVRALRESVALIDGVRADIPELAGDADLAGDRAMMAEYLALLGSPAAQQADPRQQLADSLQLAAHFKLHSRQEASVWSGE
jgi:hypothetical protein